MRLSMLVPRAIRLLAAAVCGALACAVGAQSPDAVGKIVNGKIVSGATQYSASLTVPRNLYPFSLRLAFRDAKGEPHHFCNAVLIRPQWAVTGAHCVRFRREGLSVFFGNEADFEREVLIKTTLVHEQFEEVRLGNDIALLRLAMPVSDPYIPIADDLQRVVPAAVPEGAGQFLVAGWGAFTENEHRMEDVFRSPVQRHLNVALISWQVCNIMYSGKVTSGQICAASGIEGIDACIGFGGAPLMQPNRRGKLELAGLVSWGEGCARRNKPTVYTNVPHYAEWIASKLREHGDAGAPIADSDDAPRPSPTGTGGRIQGRIAETQKTPGLVPDGLFRFAASLGRKGKNQAEGHFCGGVLLNRGWILTAAHCVSEFRDAPTTLQIKVDTGMLSQGGALLTAQRIVTHPEYRPTPLGSYMHDVALVAVAGDVPADIHVPPLLEPGADARYVAANADATVIGWGNDAFSKYARRSNYLRMATIPIVSNDFCNGNDLYKGLVDDNMLCAGGSGTDACQGDSGGALLVVDERTDYIIAGLVSWGEGCGEKPIPGVYVKLSPYLEWIRSQVAAPIKAGES